MLSAEDMDMLEIEDDYMVERNEYWSVDVTRYLYYVIESHEAPYSDTPPR